VLRTPVCVRRALTRKRSNRRREPPSSAVSSPSAILALLAILRCQSCAATAMRRAAIGSGDPDPSRSRAASSRTCHPGRDLDRPWAARDSADWDPSGVDSACDDSCRVPDLDSDW